MCPMATVQRWTGAETKALRQAMRLSSVRSFAAHLGVDARTMNKWEARGRRRLAAARHPSTIGHRARQGTRRRREPSLPKNTGQTAGGRDTRTKTQPLEQNPSTTILADDVMPAAAGRILKI